MAGVAGVVRAVRGRGAGGADRVTRRRRGLLGKRRRRQTAAAVNVVRTRAIIE